MVSTIRSPFFTLIIHSIACLWVLWKIMHLGQSDFGEYKWLLAFLFGSIGIGAYFFVPDFLSVRSIAIIMLLTSNHILDSAYMQEPLSRLYLVGFIYIMIILSIILGAIPWLIRPVLQKLSQYSLVSRILCTVISLYGLWLITIAYTL